MKNNRTLYLMMALLLTLGLGACQSDYSKMLNEEMAKGVRNDSLFFGIHFQQAKRDFYELCWKKNQEGLFTAGSRGNYVQYNLPPDSIHSEKIEMFFYPQFDSNEQITGMDLEYRYAAWAPWNKALYAPELLPRIKDTLMAWYGGNDFIAVEGEQPQETIWVKVDGNRRIAIKTKDDEIVRVKMTDMTTTIDD